MYSLSQRINQVFNVAVLYGGVIVVLVALVSQWQLIHDNAFGLSSSIGGVSPSFNVRTSRYYGSVKGQPKENMRIEFDLDADLSPLFNWNTKQVFVYLTASYNGTEKARGHTVNTVTLWDKIIKTPKEAELHLEHAKVSKDLTFELQWNIQPWVGILTFGQTTGSEVVKVEPKKKPSPTPNADASQQEQQQQHQQPKKKKRVPKNANA
ncbi:related to Signal peptidase complex subunit SPC3 [Nakaseomyces glabratus]|nr:related to Signal peptidase complex subunit SPC3 [Nakaseomyces glabratus]SLM11671.1 related to Signal peptidase complex subunit SPC3 [Nakaseomyces glabratus]